MARDRTACLPLADVLKFVCGHSFIRKMEMFKVVPGPLPRKGISAAPNAWLLTLANII